MAIRKSDSCNWPRWGLCLAFLVLAAAVEVRPAAETPVPQTPAPTQSSAAPPANDAGKAVDDLTRELGQCRDESTARYLRYRLGILQFKAGLWAEAAAAFTSLAREPQVPELLRMGSLNMVGQIARLQGEHAQALRAFADLAALTEKWPSLDPNDRCRPTFRTLWRAALISRAEIQESQKDSAAAAEYERVWQGEKDVPPGATDANPVPLVADRLAQLYLERQDIGKYLSLTADLVARFPAYPRTPMVELERLCVQVLQDVPAAREYPPGVQYAPTRFIAYLRGGGAVGPAAAALNDIERLCRKYQGTAPGLVLDYHYAWMLDAIGRRDQAIDVLARIAAPSEPAPAGVPEVAASQEDILRRYAALQRALLLTERKDYDKALEILAGLPPAPDKKSHLALLAEAMTRNVQTLKREVPKDVPKAQK